MTISWARKRARFAQRFENRNEVAGRRAYLVHGLDDVVQARAGLEHEHPGLPLIDVDVGLADDDGVASGRTRSVGSRAPSR